MRGVRGEAGGLPALLELGGGSRLVRLALSGLNSVCCNILCSQVCGLQQVA